MNRLAPQPREWIDRERPVQFRFEGRTYEGFAGDTISTALWANGVRTLGRSFKYHRPRGIFSLSDADTNAMMQWGNIPNVRADITPVQDGMDLRAVNTRGGVEFDRLASLDMFGAFTPVGFYYKAFHTPRSLFPWYEKKIRGMAGLGTIPDRLPHGHTPKDYTFCDVLVVGAGPAGLAAAAEAAEAGAQVLLVERQPHLGGSLSEQYRSDPDWETRLDRLVTAVETSERIEIRRSTTAVGYFSDHWVALVDDRRLTKLRAKAVVVATGCRQQPCVFRNNDLPGVMLAGAAQGLMAHYAVKPCTTAVVLTANDDGYRAALDLLAGRVSVPALVDMRNDPPGSPLVERVRSAGISVLTGQGVCEGLRGHGLGGVRVCALAEDGSPQMATARDIGCDGLLVSVGWAPVDELLRQGEARMVYDESLHQFVPATLPDGLFAAGRVNGIYDLKAREADGRRAGRQAAGKRASKAPKRAGPSPNHPYPVIKHPKGKDFVELDEDIQTKDFLHAIQEGYDSPELMKRYTTVGMGPSQGKHANLTSLRILARARGESMDGQVMTTARPYATPVRLGHLAGRSFTARRRTPTHAWHEARGAKLMLAGNWYRPEYYPVAGRSREQCIEEEALNVRTRVGLIDLGTLGKLEVNGPDAAAFLGRIYTGGFDKLKVGKARYGVACDESGVMIDDGIVGRLAEDRFYVSTTTSGSDAIARKMLWWLVQWQMDVQLVNATSTYGAMNLAGPSSLQVLTPLVDIALDEASFPYMGMQECTVAGVPARVSRVGFVGELGYEIHPRADGTMHVWNALMEAGKSAGIRPFGVEAQRLLRLEKGHIILGQDSDGLTSPYEADCGWAVRMKKPFFVGQRSLGILAARDQERTLVGFVLDKDYRGAVPKECHLVIDGPAILGRVTSAKFSPTLKQVIGLAYVPPARSEVGTTLSIKIDGGEVITGTVVKLPFYDPDGERQRLDVVKEDG